MTVEFDDVDFSKFGGSALDPELKIELPWSGLSSVSDANDLNFEPPAKQNVLDLLERWNQMMAFGPFRIAYRTINESLLIAASLAEKSAGEVLDWVVMTKLLPRLEGDEEKLRSVTDENKSVLDHLLEEWPERFWGDMGQEPNPPETTVHASTFETVQLHLFLALTMAARFEALRRTTAAWTLTLTTAQEPQVQLKGLIRALGRQDAGSLRSAVEVCTPGAQTVTVISTPSVFENTAYTLTLIPEAGWEITEVRHPVRQDVGDSLERIGIAPGLWHGTLNTGNNIGWFPLEIALRPLGGDGAVRIHRVAWQVWPLKLDYASDLNAMTKKIEEIYPLWLFRFDTPTVHDTGPSSRGMTLFCSCGLHSLIAYGSKWREGSRRSFGLPTSLSMVSQRS